MTKYILLGWPDSQPFLSNKKCIHASGEEPCIFVPEELFLKKQGKQAAAKKLLDTVQLAVAKMKRFVFDNVTEKGIKLTKNEIDNQELRVDYCNHYTGENSRMTVTKILRHRIEGVDDYGNEDSCSIDADLSYDGIYDIVRFLVYCRGKSCVI